MSRCTIESLTVPQSVNEALIRWLCINRVFWRLTELKQVTRTAILQATESIETELPLFGLTDTATLS